MPQTHPDLIMPFQTSFTVEPLEGKDPLPVMQAGCRVLAEMGLAYWLSAGTALGLHRDGGFIPHDTDIDVEVLLHWSEPLANELVRDEIVGRMSLLGWRLIRELQIGGPSHPIQLAFTDAANIIFDIYFFYDDIEEGVLLNYNDHGTLRQPSGFFVEREMRKIGGFEYPLPAPVEEYLEMRYGDWRTPRGAKTDWGEDAANLSAYSDEPGPSPVPPASLRGVVGYIDGTFDLFHFGHVNVLRQAHSMCDVLVVGVATDELCRGAKLLETVMSQAERKAVVSACRFVDFVVDHEALDETDLIRSQEALGMRIDVHLVGEDYGCWGAEQDRRLAWCEANGVMTFRLQRTPSISTTEVKSRIAGISRLDDRG